MKKVEVITQSVMGRTTCKAFRNQSDFEKYVNKIHQAGKIVCGDYVIGKIWQNDDGSWNYGYDQTALIDNEDQSAVDQPGARYEFSKLVPRSKEDEISFLKAIQKSVTEAPFLKELFTDEFMTDMESRIYSEISCNIFDDLQSIQQEKDHFEHISTLAEEELARLNRQQKGKEAPSKKTIASKFADELANQGVMSLAVHKAIGLIENRIEDLEDVAHTDIPVKEKPQQVIVYPYPPVIEIDGQMYETLDPVTLCKLVYSLRDKVIDLEKKQEATK